MEACGRLAGWMFRGFNGLEFKLGAFRPEHFGIVRVDYMEAIIPYAFANLLDSTSITGFNYFLQQVGKIKYMAYYDYGPTENMRRYNRTTPENVNLAATTVPCSFYAMGRSTIAVTEDVRDTWLALAKSAQSTFAVLEKYNGVSPFGAVDAENLYGPAIRQLIADLTGIP